MKYAAHSNLPKLIVEAIMKAQNDRRGFRQNWDDIDAEVQKECIASWEGVVADQLLAAGIDSVQPRSVDR